jgi:fructose-specific phosphotransferase system IIC component
LQAAKKEQEEQEKQAKLRFEIGMFLFTLMFPVFDVSVF